ncbi:hypothetical protein GCM10009087_44400 [Sphingomonas oligophenolica]|uniref:Uncharacterized protein n=1 Tax=Sphingomonas oligophenolica TaxID=301154 RepID=A0ABU9XZV7_9SPHN
MSVELWSGAGLALALAVFAGLRDRQRKRRKNLDKVGIVDWPAVQVIALIGTAILASIAYNS